MKIPQVPIKYVYKNGHAWVCVCVCVLIFHENTFVCMCACVCAVQYSLIVSVQQNWTHSEIKVDSFKTQL